MAMVIIAKRSFIGTDGKQHNAGDVVSVCDIPVPNERLIVTARPTSTSTGDATGAATESEDSKERGR